MPPSREKPRRPRRPDVPREEAELRLIEATIALANERPRLSDITTRLIADRAELNIAHINRYFGSREELFVRVADHLAAGIGEAIADLDQQQIFVFFRSDPSVVLRSRILSHLIGDGIDPGRFTVMPRLVERFTKRFAEQLGVSERTARAFLLKSLAATHGGVLFARTYGATDRDRNDGLQLALIEAAGLAEAERRLGWVD